MKNPPPVNTRKSRSHTASQMSNQSGINENEATRDIPAKVTGESSECSNHEAAWVDTLGISSSPRKKHKGMKNSQPLNTRKMRSHTASRISNHFWKCKIHKLLHPKLGITYSQFSKSDINENVATRDIPTKATGESSGCSNLEARQIGCNELPPGTWKLRVSVRSDEGINLFVELNSHSSDWAKKLKSEVCIHPEMLNASSRVLYRELGVFEECEEQTKESFLGTKAVKSKTAGDPKVIESFPCSVVRDLPEENISSSATIPKNIAESSLVRESGPKVSSLCRDNSQNSVDLSSDSHHQSGNVTSVSAGSKVSDISENGSRSDNKCPGSAETVPMPTLVSCKPNLPIVSKFCEDRTPLITSAIENPGGVTPPPSELPCPEPLVEEQVELVNNSALLPDIQSEPPRPEPPFEDQVELVNNPYLGSASQPDIQLHNGIQSEPLYPEPLVEDQVELVNYSASGSASQPDIRLDNGIRYGHITSQQAEDPTQQPATEEHAELPFHDVVVPLRAMLQLPMSIGSSLGGSGPSGTCVSDSRSMGGVPDSINHPRQSAPMTSSQSLLHHDTILNESVSIRKEQDQVGLVINSASHPNTQLDYGIQSGHNTSQRAEFPTQPATTEEHSRLPSYNDALQDTMLKLPVGGSVTRVSDFRSLGVVPDCISHPLQIAPMASSQTSQTLLQDDPLLYELTRIRQELEQAVKFHEQLTMWIRFDFYKEMQEINKKYSKLHHDNDTALARTKKAIHTNYNKVFMNALLAKYYRDTML